MTCKIFDEYIAQPNKLTSCPTHCIATFGFPVVVGWQNMLRFAANDIFIQMCSRYKDYKTAISDDLCKYIVESYMIFLY